MNAGDIPKNLGLWWGGGGCRIGLHQVESLQRIPMDIFPRLIQGQSLF